MKRILSLFLAALMVLSLAACGAEPAAPETSEEPAVTEAPAESPLRLRPRLRRSPVKGSADAG